MKTVLLVDDDRDCLTTLGEDLNRIGYNVLAETRGRAALTLLTGGTAVGAVITECSLMDMDGAEFLGALRHHAPSAPIIVLTAHGTVENYLQCLNLGVFEYTHKPLPPKELERIVAAAFGARPNPPGKELSS